MPKQFTQRPLYEGCYQIIFPSDWGEVLFSLVCCQVMAPRAELWHCCNPISTNKRIFKLHLAVKLCLPTPLKEKRTPITDGKGKAFIAHTKENAILCIWSASVPPLSGISLALALAGGYMVLHGVHTCVYQCLGLFVMGVPHSSASSSVCHKNWSVNSIISQSGAHIA